MTGHEDPVDRATIIELRALIEDSEPQGFGKFIRQYVDDSLETLAALQAAALAQDAQALQAAAHSLKGSSANFGAKGMISLCAEIEMQAKRKDVSAVRIAFLVAEFGRVRQALAAMCAPQR